MRIRVRVPVFTLLILSSAWLVAGQPAAQRRETSAESVASYQLNQLMPVDPEAAVGTLPNGLRYYVRPNAKPPKRAELRLVVKAGSVLEDDDQRGLAHFVEHMQFEGTRNFPGQAINDFLGDLGLSIGADANAATSYDDTQYTLRVPTGTAGVLDRALLILEDWAGAATFDQSSIDRQRGIVLSEWRMHLGAGERVGERIRKVELEGTRYADRPPIGDPAVIEAATRAALVRYYHDWYRPNLMAVIVVGDVDRDATVKMIRDHFSTLRNPSPERPRPTYDITERPGTRYAFVTDKENTSTVVQVSNLRPARNQGSVGGYRDIMLDQLFAAMLGSRLDEVSQNANPPFLRAAADRALFPTIRTRDEALLQALVASDGVARGLEALVTELQRVSHFGFTASELERAKQAMMLSYERVVTESPDRESPSRADEYTRNFLQNEALPTIWQELAFHRRFMPQVALAEINALNADWFPERNRLVLVSAPDAAGVTLPTQTQLEAAVRAATTQKLEPWVDTASGQTLMETPPKPGSITGTVQRADAGVTEWKLSNGATVVLKPTTLKEDQILFRAFAPGGTSLASDADFPSARAADSVIAAGGAGQFNAVTLDKLLNGKAVVVQPFIDEIDQGMGGGSTPQDLEALFQLLHLRFTQPRADPTAFASMAAQARSLLANQQASPDVVFNQTVDAAVSGNHPRRQPETSASVDRWNLDTALAFYKARFADASNFTFVFVGSFTIDTIKPLVETYVASLPATNTHETWRDLGIHPPAKVVEKTVEKGIAPKSQVAIVFSGPFDYDLQHLLGLRTMTMLLQSRLFDTIRQELGGTYSITAAPDADKLPRPEYTVRIEWTCDPARTDMLVQRVFQEIEFVKSTRFDGRQMGLVREPLLREYEANSQDNRYFLQLIARTYEDGDGAAVAQALDVPAQIRALTSNDIQQAAQRELDASRYVKVVLMPEKK
ncbi:MAG TPA: insulinase family protein [Vicinamibacterales bacterium]